MKRLRRGVGIICILYALAGIVAQHPSAADDLAMAQAAQAQWQWDRAATWYQDAAKLSPNPTQPLRALAQIRLWQGRLAQAATAITQAERAARDDPANWRLAGDIALAEHDVAAARQGWLRVIILAPTSASATQAATELARLDLRQGAPALVLPDTQQVAHPTPENREDTAIARFHLGQAQAALALFDGLTTLSPSGQAYRAIALNWQGTAQDEAVLGYTDLAQGYAALALEPLQAAVKAQPTYGAGYALLGWAAWSTGALPQARLALMQAERFAPADATTVGLAALMQAQDGDATGALRRVAAWQAHHIPSIALWRMQAQLATLANVPALAEDALWQLATTLTSADQLAAQLNLARFYLQTQLGRDDGRADWLFGLLRQVALANATAADLVAQWDWQTDHPAAALADLTHALALDPAYAPAHRDLATYAAALGDTTTAELETACATALGA
jgi:hypothetical protein